METKLIKQRKPTPKERKEHEGAEVVFVREDRDGKTYTIYACTCYESWQQWGEGRDILSDNVDDVERWRRSLN